MTSFLKTVTMLAACGASLVSAGAFDITVVTTNSTRSSATVTETEKSTVNSGFQTALRTYSGFGSCAVDISNATDTKINNSSNLYSWTFKLSTSGSGAYAVPCAQATASARVAVNSKQFADEYNKISAAVAISGPVTSVTGVSSAGGLNAMIASAAAAAMLMVVM